MGLAFAGRVRRVCLGRGLLGQPVYGSAQRYGRQFGRGRRGGRGRHGGLRRRGSLGRQWRLQLGPRRLSSGHVLQQLHRRNLHLSTQRPNQQHLQPGVRLQWRHVLEPVGCARARGGDPSRRALLADGHCQGLRANHLRDRPLQRGPVLRLSPIKRLRRASAPDHSASRHLLGPARLMPGQPRGSRLRGDHVVRFTVQPHQNPATVVRRPRLHVNVPRV